VRAIVLDGEDRVLLCRFHFDLPDGPLAVWAAPGGGVESGEPPLAALCRELDEEIGLELRGEPPHAWHQQFVEPGHAEGYDGVINDYYLVRAETFTPRGAMSDAQLAAENIAGFRWWTMREIAEHDDASAVSSPRALGKLLPTLVVDSLPAEPLKLGL
jgi:ADP-ribose pyrophosphatase YjhB (NUDIX family)